MCKGPIYLLYENSSWRWTRFVRKKRLKSYDIVIFYRLQNPYFFIDIKYKMRIYNSNFFLTYRGGEEGEKW